MYSVYNITATVHNIPLKGFSGDTSTLKIPCENIFLLKFPLTVPDNFGFQSLQSDYLHYNEVAIQQVTLAKKLIWIDRHTSK